MDNGFRIKTTLLIVLLLMLVALVVFIIGNSRETESYTVERTAAPVATADGTAGTVYGQTQSQQLQNGNAGQQYTGTAQTTGSTQQAVIEFTPVPTVAPTPTLTPVPTPIPTVAPTPDPQPVGTILGGGTLISDTGTLLDIHADWTATVASEDTVTVGVTVYVDHYQLHNNGSRALFITFGDDTKSLDTPDIMYDVSGAKTSTSLGSTTFTVSLDRYASLTTGLHVKWAFGGVYGDGRGNSVDLSTITCGGDITISR